VLDVALATFVDMPAGWVDDHLLVDALRELGISSSFVCWDDPDARWPSAGMVLLRSTWDYHQRLNAFLGWVDYVGSVTKLCNPAEVIRWNSHKQYLIELADQGVTTIPTRLVLAGEHATLEEGLQIIKPAVSVGADRTIRGATQADLDALVATDDALVQPYVPEVETEGELSIVCIAGEPTHVVRKVPATGDFRAQEQHGASFDAIPIQVDHAQLARAAIDAARATTASDDAPLYARVDAVPVEGQLHLMELELIEPTLWLRWHPAAATSLAFAVAAALDSR
jgi:hypothetical protein